MHKFIFAVAVGSICFWLTSLWIPGSHFGFPFQAFEYPPSIPYGDDRIPVEGLLPFFLNILFWISAAYYAAGFNKSILSKPWLLVGVVVLAIVVTLVGYVFIMFAFD